MEPMPVSALAGIALPGRHGRPDGAPGVVVRELPSAGLATVTARKGRSAELIAAAEAAFGVALPTTPRRVESGGLAFAWSGPERWLAHAASEPPGGMEALLARALGAHAAIVDQSHARVLLCVSGPCVRDALARGVAIDLHPAAFKPGDTAVTAIAHIHVQLWQRDDAPSYVLGVARSLAGSLWDWLAASAAEHGLELAPPAPSLPNGRGGTSDQVADGVWIAPRTVD
jgi:sarcosine oxidase subunit gamma